MSARLEAHNAYALAETPADLRALCQGDLFFLLVHAMGRKDIDNDWLYARCREVQAAPDGHLDLWAREHYKALHMDTPVLTTLGWKRHGDLMPGDFVFAPDGSPVEIIAVKRFQQPSECYKVSFRAGAEIIAAGDHLWTVHTWNARRLQGEKRVGWELNTVETRSLLRGYKKPYISLAAPLQGCGELPIKPYTLGAWLGDGDNAAGRISGADPDIFTFIQQDEYQLSHNHCPQREPFAARTVYGLGAVLRQNGLINDKHIPNAYITATLEDRLALLQGLMDTDGYQGDKDATFTNANKRLAFDVLSLVCSLGWKGRINTNKAGSWQVTFASDANDHLAPFRLSRKLSRRRVKSGRQQSAAWYIQSVEPVSKADVNCIQVNSKEGLYLCGRHLIPTHNSTIITVGKTIQDILNDPEITVGIFSHTRPIAKSFLRQIKRELEGNALLQEFFPHIKPPVGKSGRTWSEDGGLMVKRESNPKEATVEAWGLVDGQPTGKHFSVLVYDDVVTLDSVTTPEMIAKVTDAWSLSLNLGAQGGRRRIIGTRYHFNDTYRTIMERGAALPRLHPATVDGRMDGEPVFLDKQTLTDKRRDMGPYVFGCQMLQDPKADAVQGFKREWLKFADIDPQTRRINPRGMNVYILCDPAGEKKRGSDYTVILAIGLASDGNHYLIDGIRDRLNLTERTAALFAMHRRWRPLLVGYEHYGMQADIEHLQFVQKQENYRFKVVELGGPMPKNDRIRRLVPLFEQGRFYLPNALVFADAEGKHRDFVQEFVNEEYLAFPVSGHDDMLDCMSRIVEPDMGAVFPMAVERKNDWKRLSTAASTRAI